MFDLLGDRAVELHGDTRWITPITPSTGYIFAAAIFWLFCFGMSRYSRLHGAPARHRPQTMRQGENNGLTPNLSTPPTCTSPPPDIAIDIIGMNKWYGDFPRAARHQPARDAGERIVIAGPSGSGKSTMIRCINRLEEHQKGQIIVDGIELTNDLKKIDEVRREVGMVFQHFNLFPHLTILEN
jgi:hypothetical protein